METMTEVATEKRIDDLREEMHSGFADVRTEMRGNFERVDTDIRELRTEMKAGFDSMHELILSMHRLMIKFFAGTVASIIAGVIVLLASHF